MTQLSLPLFQGRIHLELNQATGFKYQLLSVASVKCWEVVASSGGKVHGKALLTGTDTMQECVSVGSVEYWMRLRLPIKQAAKLYQVSVLVWAVMRLRLPIKQAAKLYQVRYLPTLMKMHSPLQISRSQFFGSM
jgi:hypothetical protein